MGNRVFGWLSINQMLFVSHLVLVLTIVLGMSYSRYHSEWQREVNQSALLAKSQFNGQLTWFSTAVAGRNYANLMMPTTRTTVWEMDKLLFMEVSGTTDYQNKMLSVRYRSRDNSVWRTDSTLEELQQLQQKQRVLREQKSQTPTENQVRHKKYDYLINKRAKDIEALRRSQRLAAESPVPWVMPEQLASGYFLDEAAEVLHIQIGLSNQNGGVIWAVFDAKELVGLKHTLVVDLFQEALVAMLISLVLIYAVTIWIVGPLKDLSLSMKQDIDHIDLRSLPELRRRDEIGELARAYSGLVTKIRHQLKVLQKLSDTDPLTGLGSRHKYARTAEQFLHEARVAGRYVTVMICDIDNFKQYNDTYGHTDGDNALCSVADALESMLSREPAQPGAAFAGGVAYRFGGEEFVVLCSTPEQARAKVQVNALRQVVEATGLAHTGNAPFNVITISVGAVVISPQVAAGAERYDSLLDSALKLADKKLYSAKAKGRNQVAIADM